MEHVNLVLGGGDGWHQGGTKEAPGMHQGANLEPIWCNLAQFGANMVQFGAHMGSI